MKHLFFFLFLLTCISASPQHENLIIDVKGIPVKMIWVQGGTFTMGATDDQTDDAYECEKPAHSVTLHSYYIGQTEVTQALWKAVMDTISYVFKGNNLPVDQVCWNDCRSFITKLNSLTGMKFRLPTEAEWEYAAHGGNKSQDYKYSGSDILGNIAWYADNSDGKIHPVATKLPNELGIYDMSGNVWEWCQDRYRKYSSRARSNPTGPLSGSSRVIRGGDQQCIDRDCRTTNRTFHKKKETIIESGLGFRLALSE